MVTDLNFTTISIRYGYTVRTRHLTRLLKTAPLNTTDKCREPFPPEEPNGCCNRWSYHQTIHMSYRRTCNKSRRLVYLHGTADGASAGISDNTSVNSLLIKPEVWRNYHQFWAPCICKSRTTNLRAKLAPLLPHYKAHW